MGWLLESRGWILEHGGSLQSSRVCFVSAIPEAESFCPANLGANAMVDFGLVKTKRIDVQ